LEKDTGTVSETVSESIARAVKNSGELKQIILDFTGDFAIFLTLNHAFQVAARLFTGNHRRRLQEGRRKPPKHPSQVENRRRKPAARRRRSSEPRRNWPEGRRRSANTRRKSKITVAGRKTGVAR
jgi:hypothetical protein